VNATIDSAAHLAILRLGGAAYVSHQPLPTTDTRGDRK
jgi:hypothetical protein